MSDETPILDTAVEDHIRNLPWGDDTPDYVRTLVAGNIRGAISALIEQRVLIPMDALSAWLPK